jgi:tRNA-specific 2-thiouridylase
MKKQKILLAMSGGVDSSVAAYLLKKQGYEIIGAFMKNWSNTKNNFGECAWRGERRYALKIAAMLEIPLITLDFEKEYKKLVVEKMFKLYRQGITPNPDIDCNEKIKFPLLIKAAKKLGCDYIATGHYARIIKTKNNFELHRAKDESKDQSYFLYRLKQKELAKTLFPIDNLTKSQVREIAKKQGFPNYDKKSTVGICFIGKINLKSFLQKKIKPKKGIILDPDGNKIGDHDGIYYYTIGQRIGPRFGIEIKKQELRQKRWYVARKIKNKNIIIAAPEGHKLNFRKEILVKDTHWIDNNNFSPSSIKTKSISSEARLSLGRVGGKEIKVFSRIRQVGELLPSKIKLEKGKIKVTLNKAITGVSEGQAIVLYQGTKCIGGGVISFQ